MRSHVSFPNSTIPITVKIGVPGRRRRPGLQDPAALDGPARTRRRAAAGRRPARSRALPATPSRQYRRPAARPRTRRTRRAEGRPRIDDAAICSREPRGQRSVRPTPASTPKAAGGLRADRGCPPSPATTSDDQHRRRRGVQSLGLLRGTENSGRLAHSNARRSTDPRNRDHDQERRRHRNRAPGLMNSPVGNSMMKPRSPACARAVGAREAASAPSPAAAVTRFSPSRRCRAGLPGTCPSADIAASHPNLRAGEETSVAHIASGRAPLRHPPQFCHSRTR